jgi:hypothetical protein
VEDEVLVQRPIEFYYLTNIEKKSKHNNLKEMICSNVLSEEGQSKGLELDIWVDF